MSYRELTPLTSPGYVVVNRKHFNAMVKEYKLKQTEDDVFEYATHRGVTLAALVSA